MADPTTGCPPDCGHDERRTVSPAMTEDPVPTRAEVAEACLNWFETSHSERQEHDHHCRAGRWENFKQVEVEDEDCTCGWRAFRQAYERMARDD